MPSIAFLSLIYLLLAVPGFLYRSFYYSGEFTRDMLPRNWTSEIGKAIVLSVPFHALWILVFQSARHIGLIHYTVSFESVVRLIAGEYGTREHSFHAIIGRLYENLGYVAGYYLLVIVTAVLAGYWARKIVWGQELDVKRPWLRYRSDWLYKIMGRGALKDVPFKDTEAWIDILSEQETSIPGKAMLYRGLAAGYTTEENGALRDVILTEVKRTDGDKDLDGNVRWARVPGKFFVISYSKIRNMNITYEQHSKKILQQIESLPSMLPGVSVPPASVQSSPP
jgi:hypothetical protein